MVSTGKESGGSPRRVHDKTALERCKAATLYSLVVLNGLLKKPMAAF